MEIERNENFIAIKSVDENGEFTIEIQKDCSQIRFDSDAGDAYANINLKTLKAIRDIINEVLQPYTI